MSTTKKEKLKTLVEDNYYAVLGVTISASTDEIRTAFRNIATLTHPDKGTVKSSSAFVAASEAYATLKSVKMRKEYNQMLSLFLHKCSPCGGKGIISSRKGFNSVTSKSRCKACNGLGFVI